MIKLNSLIWLSILLIFLLPTSAGRFLIDMAGGFIILLLILSLFLGGAGWLTWRSIKSNIKSCKNCGTQFLSDSEICPACGSRQTLSNDNFDKNIPASAATIDIDAEESD